MNVSVKAQEFVLKESKASSEQSRIWWRVSIAWLGDEWLGVRGLIGE